MNKVTKLINEHTSESIRLITKFQDVQANAIEDSSTSNLASLIEYASVKDGYDLDYIDTNQVNYKALRNAISVGQQMELAA